MRYVVKKTFEDDMEKYAIIDSRANDIFCKDMYNGLIFLLNNKEDAETVCYILNKDEYGLKEMDLKMLNKDSFKMGDIVTIKNHEFDLGFIKMKVNDQYYLVEAVDKYGYETGIDLYLHKNEITHQF